MWTAITREVSPALADCLLSFVERDAIDLPLARMQHAAYRAALDPDRELPPAFLLQVHEPEQLPPCARWAETSDGGVLGS